MKSPSKSAKPKSSLLNYGKTPAGTLSGRPAPLPPATDKPPTDRPPPSLMERWVNKICGNLIEGFILAVFVLTLVLVALHFVGCQQVVVQLGPGNTADKALIKVTPETSINKEGERK